MSASAVASRPRPWCTGEKRTDFPEYTASSAEKGVRILLGYGRLFINALARLSHFCKSQKTTRYAGGLKLKQRNILSGKIEIVQASKKPRKDVSYGK